MQIKRYIFIAILLLCSQSSSKAIDYEFNGYVYVLPTIQSIPKSADRFGLNTSEDYFALNLTRLRLRPSLFLSDNSRITLHYETDMVNSKISSPFLGNLGKTNRQAVDLNWTIANGDYVRINHFIDRLYFKQMFDWGETTFGRQRIQWGTGRIWQPTDLFNPINPADFSKFEKDGTDAMSVKYYLGNMSDIELVYNFSDVWKNANYGGRVRTNFMEYDISAMGGYFDKRVAVGGDFDGNFFGGGFRGEALYSAARHNDVPNDSISPNAMPSYVKFILGLDYQFNSKLYALVEYQYNGEGATDTSKYDFVRLAKGEIQNMSQNYLTVVANYQMHPLVIITLTGLAGMNDQSGYAGVFANYSASDNANLKLGSLFFFGESGTEYSYYPTAIYLIGEYYF